MKKWWLAVVALVIVVFCAREAWLGRTQPLQIFAEKNVVLVRTPGGDVLGIGETASASAVAVQRSVVRFFEKTPIRRLRDLPVGQQWQLRGATVARVSPGLLQVVAGEQVIFLIDENFDEKTDRELAVQSGVPLDADWWAMCRVRVPVFLPPPREGIVFASDRAPSEKMQTWARAKNLPIVTVRETRGFSLKNLPDGWQLRVRE